MDKLTKIALIWGAFILGFFLLYLSSPMDGSATRQDGKEFAVLFFGAIGGTIFVMRNKQK